MRALPLPLVLLPLLTAGCVQTTTRPSSAELPQMILTAQPARAWQVIEAGIPIGRVVYYASNQDPADSLFSVQNTYSQEIGLIDSLGKAWRYRPHQAEAEWVTTGTLLEGASAILESRQSSLQEVAIATPRNPSTPDSGALEEGFGR